MNKLYIPIIWLSSFKTQQCVFQQAYKVLPQTELLFKKWFARVSNCSPAETDVGGQEEQYPKYRVCLLGHQTVGKSSLVTQFLTSDYMNTYDASLGELQAAVGRFDFPKFSLIFAPGVSIILFCIKKDLITKKVILYSKNAKISKKSRFYIIKQAILRPDSF